jgi:hypothetical protein
MKIFGHCVYQRKNNQKYYACVRQDHKQKWIYIGAEKDLPEGEEKIKNWYAGQNLELPAVKEIDEKNLKINKAILRTEKEINIKIYTKREKGRAERRQAQVYCNGIKIVLSLAKDDNNQTVTKKIIKKLIEKDLIDFDILC